MNFYNEIHTPSRGDFELLRPSAVTHIPHTVECGSRWRTYGSSSDWSSDVIKTAIGEHFERKHFYLDVPVHDTNTLDAGLTAEEHKAFIEALSQTAMNGGGNLLKHHRFDRTNVYRISDFSRCLIPTVCISISPCRNPIDNQIYPMGDTCGCSAHVDIEAAVTGALKEALERQFLLRFWLTKTCKAVIKQDKACAMLTDCPSLELFREFAKSGETIILDLTDERFPGSCILFCYGNKHKKDAKVGFCAGMAYADTPGNALKKATVELWQTFRYMLSIDSSNSQENDIEDPYLKHFMSCNKYETFVQISTQITSNPSIINRSPIPFNCRNLINTIRRLNLDGYLYLSHMPAARSNLYFCKYISPNLFLHMNNSFSFNTLNNYSRTFYKSIIPEQLTQMVPFP